MYGGFPVKLTTHIGNAIYPDFLTVDQIREQTLRNMTDLIKKNQILPGNILRAIGERFSSENEDILDIMTDEDSDPKHSELKREKKKSIFVHCLPERLKSTFFETFLSVVKFFFQKTLDFSLRGRYY